MFVKTNFVNLLHDLNWFYHVIAYLREVVKSLFEFGLKKRKIDKKIQIFLTFKSMYLDNIL